MSPVMHFKAQAENVQKITPRLDRAVLHHQLRGKECLSVTVYAQRTESFLPKPNMVTEELPGDCGSCNQS